MLRAVAGFPSLQGWRDAWIERNGELFRLAKLRRQAWRPDLPLDGQDARYRACHARLEACLHGIFETARKELKELCAPSIPEYNCPSRDGRALARLAAQAKALLSLREHREGLCVFLRDARVSLDNNASERVLRGPVIARHTCFGSGGPDGARVAGLMFGGVRDAAPGRAESLHLGAGLSRRLRRQPRPAAGAAGSVGCLGGWTRTASGNSAAPISAHTAPTALLPRQPTGSLGPPSRRQPDYRRAGPGLCTCPSEHGPCGPVPPADRTAVRTRPRGFSRFAPAGSQVTARQCVCRIELPLQIEHASRRTSTGQNGT